MNREILFREKRVDNGEWVYGYLVYDKDRTPYIAKNVETYNCDEEDDLYATSWFQTIPETIGEYTGLKDKNGKKIFEGDICIGNDYIENDNKKFIIKYGKYKTDEWKEKYSCNTYQFGWYAEFINTKDQVHLVSPNGIEVVGNIYDGDNNKKKINKTLFRGDDK